MSDDLLDRATRALRDAHTAEGAADGELGLRRLERSLGTTVRRRSRARVVALLVAASFVGIAAWASASGRLPRWLRVGTSHELAPHAEDVRPSAPPGPALAPAPAPTAEATPDLAPSAPSAPSASTTPAPLAPPARSAATASAPTVDVDALYREANDAQFVRHDPAAALAGWDRYLAAAGPSGRMTLEARYNRAIALVRLGRNEEARAALAPFARGEYGGYRRDEATRLVDSLR